MRRWRIKKMVVFECGQCHEINDPADVRCTGRCRFCGNDRTPKGASA